MSEFVDTPMSSTFNEQGKIPEGGPGSYDKTGDCPSFDAYPRTKSPNAVREKFIEKEIQIPSGEYDQY